MNYKTHIMGGITAITIINQIGAGSDIKLTSITTAGVVIGSILPDIDHPKSYIGKRARITSLAVSAVSKHRGILHTPFFITIISLLLSSTTKNTTFLIYNLVSGIPIGLFSHIFLDTLTKQGIPLLYPLSKKRFRVIGITTGGIIEKVIFVGMGLFCLNLL